MSTADFVKVYTFTNSDFGDLLIASGRTIKPLIYSNDISRVLGMPLSVVHSVSAWDRLSLSFETSTGVKTGVFLKWKALLKKPFDFRKPIVQRLYDWIGNTVAPELRLKVKQTETSTETVLPVPVEQEHNDPNAIEIEGLKGYVDENGTVWLSLKDCAIGLGIIEVREQNNKEYTRIRWARIRDYLRQINFAPRGGENGSDGLFDDAQMMSTFIPEQVFYKLSMKAENDIARAFQDKIAYDILPAIRKHGAYMTPDTLQKALLSPDFIIDLATRLKAEQEKTARLTAQVEEMAPKSAYCDSILQAPDLVPVTAIAKDYGLSGVTLNNILHKLGIQYKLGKMWCLYQQYADQGYTQSKTFLSDRKACQHTYWTQKGRLFLYKKLKAHGYLPTVEQTNALDDTDEDKILF